MRQRYSNLTVYKQMKCHTLYERSQTLGCQILHTVLSSEEPVYSVQGPGFNPQPRRKDGEKKMNLYQITFMSYSST